MILLSNETWELSDDSLILDELICELEEIGCDNVYVTDVYNYDFCTNVHLIDKQDGCKYVASVYRTDIQNEMYVEIYNAC